MTSSITFLSRSSNWPRYIVPATRLPTSKHQQAAIEQRLGHVAIDNALRQPFDNGRLADAWFADQGWVVLGAPAQNLDHTFDLCLAADHWIELAFSSAAAVRS
jgi:hypothetical protein